MIVALREISGQPLQGTAIRTSRNSQCGCILLLGWYTGSVVWSKRALFKLTINYGLLGERRMARSMIDAAFD